MWNIYEITISFNCDECGWFFSMGFLPYKDQKLWWQEARKFAAGNTIYRKRERARIFFFFFKWLWIKLLCLSALYKYFVIFHVMKTIWCIFYSVICEPKIPEVTSYLFRTLQLYINVCSCPLSISWTVFMFVYLLNCDLSFLYVQTTVPPVLLSLLSLKIQKWYLYESGCYIFC